MSSDCIACFTYFCSLAALRMRFKVAKLLYHNSFLAGHYSIQTLFSHFDQIHIVAFSLTLTVYYQDATCKHGTLHYGYNYLKPLSCTVQISLTLSKLQGGTHKGTQAFSVQKARIYNTNLVVHSQGTSTPHA